MKTTTYKCDVCRDETSVGNLHGLYWQSNMRSDFVFRSPKDCEHHVCNVCAQRIADERNKFAAVNAKYHE